MKKITVFTTTYNRAYILPNLYHSLLRQQTNDFEWLVIDDGSTDETCQLVAGWIVDAPFPIRYFKTENGGKPRAINKAVELANTPYLFIIDSDDYVADDTVVFLISKIKDIADSPEFCGIGVMQKNTKNPIGPHVFGDRDYIDASSLERMKYGLNHDCTELYKVEVMKKFPFRVWPGELFTPEEIVFNEMALYSYKVRWYNKVGVISEYLEDGLTVNAFSLLKKNPMGYAMAFNHQLRYKKNFKERFTSSYLMICYTLLGKNISYLAESNDKLITVLAFPVGVLVSVRRWWQFRKA